MTPPPCPPKVRRRTKQAAHKAEKADKAAAVGLSVGGTDRAGGLERGDRAECGGGAARGNGAGRVPAGTGTRGTPYQGAIGMTHDAMNYAQLDKKLDEGDIERCKNAESAARSPRRPTGGSARPRSGARSAWDR